MVVEVLLGGLAVGVLLASSRGRASGAPAGVSDAAQGGYYAPGSADLYALLFEGAARTGLPSSWAKSAAMHQLVDNESDGWIGRPNYTFGDVSDPSRLAEWPAIWAKLQTGWVPNKPDSSATGLGQLLSRNAAVYYPDGLAGLGDPVNEAAGMLRYIADRYGSPEVALSVYGPGQFSYTHAITGERRTKDHAGY